MSAPFNAEMLTERVVAVQGSLESDASFMIPVFLRLAVQAHQHVVLITVQQTAAHYKQVLRKLGVQLDNYVNSGQLNILDFLTDSQLLVGDTSVHPGPTSSENDQPVSTAGAKIAAAIDDAKARATVGLLPQSDGNECQPAKTAALDKPHVVVMFDNLTQLCGLLGSRDHSSAFLKHLVGSSLRSSSSILPGVSIFAVLNSDELDEDTRLHIMGSASLTVNILPLTAGHSVDVSGRVEVSQHDCHTGLPWAADPKGNSTAAFYFKSSDSNVKFFEFYDAA